MGWAVVWAGLGGVGCTGLAGRGRPKGGAHTHLGSNLRNRHIAEHVPRVENAAQSSKIYVCTGTVCVFICSFEYFVVVISLSLSRCSRDVQIASRLTACKRPTPPRAGGRAVRKLGPCPKSAEHRQRPNEARVGRESGMSRTLSCTRAGRTPDPGAPGSQGWSLPGSLVNPVMFPRFGGRVS
jgi:hypothetical protein